MILCRVILIELFESLHLFLVQKQKIVAVAHVASFFEIHGLGRNVEPFDILNVLGGFCLVMLDLLGLNSMILQRLSRFLGCRLDFLDHVAFEDDLLGGAVVFGADCRGVSFLALLGENLLVHGDFLGAWLRESHAVNWRLTTLTGLIHLPGAPIVFNLRLLFDLRHEVETIFHAGPLFLPYLVL